MGRLSTVTFRALSPETGVSVATNRLASRAAAYLSVLDSVSRRGRRLGRFIGDGRHRVRRGGVIETEGLFIQIDVSRVCCYIFTGMKLYRFVIN